MEYKMFKNKNEGKNNLCGENIRKLRLAYPTKLSQRGLADNILSTIKRYGISPDKINLEITETAANYSQNILIENMTKLLPLIDNLAENVELFNIHCNLDENSAIEIYNSLKGK